jgi:phosphoribosylformylglycinamidine (FGAM) synthase PurS component
MTITIFNGPKTLKTSAGVKMMQHFCLANPVISSNDNPRNTYRKNTLLRTNRTRTRNSFTMTTLATLISQRPTILILITLLLSRQRVLSFAPIGPIRPMKSLALSATAADFAALQERVREMRQQCLAQHQQSPPNPGLTAQGFCRSLLHALQHADDPWPDAGFQTLLESSTDTWKTLLYQSVGAPLSTPQESVASSLSSYMTRNDNQFRVLLRPDVQISIPIQHMIDFLDGSCWVECQLRDQKGQLLVVLGLSLVMENDSWMLEGMDWKEGWDLPRDR